MKRTPHRVHANTCPEQLSSEHENWMRELKTMLRGQDLGSVTLGATRKRLAQQLQLGRKGLDARKDEVSDVIIQTILELMSEPAAPEPLPDWLTPPDEDHRGVIFLVTFSSILHKPQDDSDELLALRDAHELSKEEIKDAMLDAIRDPVVESGGQGGRPRKDGSTWPLVLAVAVEPHDTRPDKTHKHVAIKVNNPSTFLPFKKTLRQRYGLASHWSTSHTLLWSAVRYVSIATEKKQQVDSAPLLWFAPEQKEQSLFELCQEPWNSQVISIGVGSALTGERFL